MEPVAARFNPSQRRDGHGRWTDGIGGKSSIFPDITPIAGTSLDLSGGNVDIVAGGDRLYVGFTLNGGGTNTSGGLDRRAAWRLAEAIKVNADKSGESDDQVKFVSTYPTGGDPHALASGRAEIRTSDGGKRVDLKLLDNDATLTMSAAEAMKLVDPLYRYGVSRRLNTEFGPLEMTLTDKDQFAFRMPDENGDPTQVAFDKSSWAGVSDAINLVWEGFDEFGETADPGQEFTVRHVQTNVGKVRVERFGGSEDFDRITVTPAEGVTGDWAIYLSGADYRNDPNGSAVTALSDLAEGARAVMGFEKVKPSKVTSGARRLTSGGTVPDLKSAPATSQSKPYGDVSYADPGYQADKKKRYPLDSEAHCRAAWSYISMPKNAGKYTPAQLRRIKTRIKSAGKKYGIDFSDDSTKAMAMADLLDVELARPGTFNLASGPLTVTADMLGDAARYAQRPGARPSPVKIGHTDPRFTGDGEPALGWLSNLRVEDDTDGPVLMGDITGMPSWLAAAAPAAWPDRSVEGWQDFEVDGETFGFVIDGLALLGVTPPGMSTIRSLRDLPQALGVAASARIVARMGDPETSAPADETNDKKEAGQMDPAKIREALGLPADASDDEVKAALTAAGLTATSPPPTDPAPPGSTAPEPAPEPQLVNAAAQPGMRLVADSVWEDQQQTIQRLTSFVDKTERDERDQVIAKAIQAGKFTPAQRTQFVRMWDANPKAARDVIESLTPNSALAVVASGYAGDGMEPDAEYSALFGTSNAQKVG